MCANRNVLIRLCESRQSLFADEIPSSFHRQLIDLSETDVLSFSSDCIPFGLRPRENLSSGLPSMRV